MAIDIQIINSINGSIVTNTDDEYIWVGTDNILNTVNTTPKNVYIPKYEYLAEEA